MHPIRNINSRLIHLAFHQTFAAQILCMPKERYQAAACDSHNKHRCNKTFYEASPPFQLFIIVWIRMLAPDLVSVTLGKFEVKCGTDRLRQVLVGYCTSIREVVYGDCRMLA